MNGFHFLFLVRIADDQRLTEFNFQCVQTFSNNGLDRDFGGTHEFAQGKILRSNLINAQLFHRIDVIDHDALDQVNWIDVEGKTSSY